MLKTLDYVGVIAFELFKTSQELLVNEVAPRVHNSGHYSQDALLESQFDLHLQCLLGETLKPPRILSKNFVMTNILGETHNEIQIPKNLKGSLHLYGKKENRPGRKMGHLNYLGANQQTLLRQARKERKAFFL